MHTSCTGRRARARTRRCLRRGARRATVSPHTSTSTRAPSSWTNGSASGGQPGARDHVAALAERHAHERHLGHRALREEQPALVRPPSSADRARARAASRAPRRRAMPRARLDRVDRQSASTFTARRAACSRRARDRRRACDTCTLPLSSTTTAPTSSSLSIISKPFFPAEDEDGVVDRVGEEGVRRVDGDRARLRRRIAGARIDDVVVALAVEDEVALVVARRREGVVDQHHLGEHVAARRRADRESRSPTGRRSCCPST